MSDSVWVEASTSSGQLAINSRQHAESMRTLLTEQGYQTAVEHFSDSGGGGGGSPDLQVTNLGVSRRTATVGEQVTVTARFTNEGDAAGGTSASAYEGSLGVTGVGPGETATPSYSFTASRPGDHTISIGGKTATVTVTEQPDSGTGTDTDTGGEFLGGGTDTPHPYQPPTGGSGEQSDGGSAEGGVLAGLDSLDGVDVDAVPGGRAGLAAGAVVAAAVLYGGGGS
jgi:hypothetical protein